MLDVNNAVFDNSAGIEMVVPGSGKNIPGLGISILDEAMDS